MARSSVRAKPYVIEIQRLYHLDEQRHHARSTPATSKPAVLPRVYSYARKSYEEGASETRHVPLDPSQVNRGSLEYEDIYNQRNYSRKNPHLEQRGRWSFRDDGGYDRVSRHARRSPGIARATEMTVMNGDGRHDGITTDRPDVTNTKYKNGIVNNNGRMRANYKGLHASTSQESSSQGQNRVTRDKKSNQHEDLERWIARQTSFPKKKDEKSDLSNQRILGRNIVSRESASNQSNSIDEKPRHFAPPVASSPRSASPALSIRSAQSGASHVSHHSAMSATSEVSVKSILKKPKVGRVVLKEEPSSYTLCAVISCILCFPFGIYALTKSKQVKESVDENDYESALSSSRKVKHFCFGVLLAYIGILAVVGALLGVYFTTGKIF